MTLFQRLFRRATAQPALPSDVLVSLLYSKLLALPDSDVWSSRTHVGFCCELPSGKFAWFQAYIGSESRSYHSPQLQIWTRRVTSEDQRFYNHVGLESLLDLPKTDMTGQMYRALCIKRAAVKALEEANKEADVQLAALDLVNDLLGLPAPEEQLALGQDYPGVEAVTVARPLPPQAREAVQ